MTEGVTVGGDARFTVSSEVGPVAKISGPDFVEWHLIQNMELDYLSRTEVGVIGTLGWVCLGAAIGLMGPAWAAFEKVGSQEFQSLDAVYMCSFAATGVLAVSSLAAYGVSLYRNRGLVDRIRERGTTGN